MKLQPVDDLVDDLALGTHGKPQAILVSNGISAPQRT
jgi:hypothetical protein